LICSQALQKFSAAKQNSTLAEIFCSQTKTNIGRKFLQPSKAKQHFVLAILQVHISLWSVGLFTSCQMHYLLNTLAHLLQTAAASKRAQIIVKSINHILTTIKDFSINSESVASQLVSALPFETTAAM